MNRFCGRIDFQAIETFIYQPTSAFDIPITVLHGLADKEVAYHDLLPWQQESRQAIAIKIFSGGHFFIFEQLNQLGQVFYSSLLKKKLTYRLVPKRLSTLLNKNIVNNARTSRGIGIASNCPWHEKNQPKQLT
ncbi:MAG: hypothetical protein ABFS56_35510 [Pseudomonadota bacterium]